MTTGPAPITGKNWQNHVEPRIMAQDLRALEQGIKQALDGGGAGSGIEEVSGTVGLGSSGAPVREFYCTGTATIGGVSFPAGTAVVWRRTVDGQWGYIVVDGWTDVAYTPDPEPIPVTAIAPTFTDDTTLGGGTWTTPTITGVTYSPAAGTATPEQAVTITATAQPGYTLTGTTTWTHTFAAAPPATGLNYVSGAAQAASQAGATFTNLAIGAPSTDRRVIAAVYNVGTWPADETRTVTIGGVTAVQLHRGVTAKRSMALYAADVPTGTTADVVITDPRTATHWTVALWTHDKPVTVTGTAVASPDTVEGNQSVTVDTVVGGSVLVIHGHNSASSSMTGATSRYVAERAAFGDATTTATTHTVSVVGYDSHLAVVGIE